MPSRPQSRPASNLASQLRTLPSRLVIACVLLATFTQIAAAQSADDAAPRSVAQTPSAEPKSESGMYLNAMTVTPLSRIAPGGVLSIRCIVGNSSDAPATGYLVGRVDTQLGQEDRRRIELPAHGHGIFDVHLRLANTLPPSAIDVTMTLNVMQADREVLAYRDNEPVLRKLHLPLSDEKNITAISLNREPAPEVYWRWPPEKSYHSYEFVIASRIDARLTRQCAVLDGEPFSLNRIDWKNVNTLVVSQENVFDDAASVAVMQQFLQGGGRVWIMLDQIDSSLVRDLLDDDQQIETVDTVLLNRFEVEVADQSFALQDRIFESVDPIPMKRVVQQGGEVIQTIDGWPAAVWMQVGSGELVLTCLGSAGWLNHRQSQFTGDPRFQAPFTLPIWANPFAQRMHNDKPKQPLALANATYPIDRIGNPVVARSFVAMVLISFCAFLIALAGWRFAGGQIKLLGLVIPAAAAAASLPLLVTSMLQRKEIPAMQSTLQFAQIDPRAGMYLRESSAVYTDESQTMELLGERDGLAFPSEAIDSGIKTLVEEDFQQWRLSNTAWPAGTWRYSAETTYPEIAVAATATLSQDGLAIKLPEAIKSPMQDVVVTLVPGAPVIGKAVDGANRVLVSGDLPAEGERWTSDTMVNDEQRRRAVVYRELFEKPNAGSPPLRTLCGWIEPWQQAPKWNADLEQRGSALVTLPIRILTPDVGMKVVIPYSLITIQHADKQSASPIFNQSTGKFSPESTLQVNTDFAFELPHEVVPLDVASIDIDWDIKAPKRTAKLSCVIEGEAIELANLNEPSIPFQATVSDPRILQSMRDGRIVLRLEIQGGDSASSEQSNFVSWQIKHLRLTVAGRTLPRNQLVTTSNQ